MLISLLCQLILQYFYDQVPLKKKSLIMLFAEFLHHNVIILSSLLQHILKTLNQMLYKQPHMLLFSLPSPIFSLF